MPYRFTIFYLPSIVLTLAAVGAVVATRSPDPSLGWAIIGLAVLGQMCASGSLSAELSRLQDLAEKRS